MNSAMEFPHAIYLIRRNGLPYVGLAANLANRLKQHETSYSVEYIAHFVVPTRYEAEGVEATLHQLQKQGIDVEPFMDVDFYVNHSLWFNRDCKGYPKHLVQKPQPRF